MMDDDEFLGYCGLHCETDLGEFHRDHIRRLIVLAGDTPPERMRATYCLGPGYIKPLVRRARAKIAAVEYARRWQAAADAHYAEMDPS